MVKLNFSLLKSIKMRKCFCREDKGTIGGIDWNKSPVAQFQTAHNPSPNVTIATPPPETTHAEASHHEPSSPRDGGAAAAPSGASEKVELGSGGGVAMVTFGLGL